jgi:hypothetical protein
MNFSVNNLILMTTDSIPSGYTPDSLALCLYEENCDMYESYGANTYNISYYQEKGDANISAKLKYWNPSYGYDTSDPSLILDLEFDNNAAIGENESLVVDLSGHSNATKISSFFEDSISGRKITFNTSSAVIRTFFDYQTYENYTFIGVIQLRQQTEPFARIFDSFNLTTQQSGTFLFHRPTGQIGFRTYCISDGSNRYLSIEPSTNYTNNRYHHFVGKIMSYDSYIELYIDGVRQTNYINSTCYGGLKLNNIKQTIGNYISETSSLNGSIDSFRIYNESKSADWIWNDFISSNLNYQETDYYPNYNDSLVNDIIVDSNATIVQPVLKLSGTGLSNTTILTKDISMESGTAYITFIETLCSHMSSVLFQPNIRYWNPFNNLLIQTNVYPTNNSLCKFTMNLTNPDNYAVSIYARVNQTSDNYKVKYAGDYLTTTNDNIFNLGANESKLINLTLDVNVSLQNYTQAYYADVEFTKI